MKYLQNVNVKLNKETEFKKQWQEILNKITDLENLSIK